MTPERAPIAPNATDFPIHQLSEFLIPFPEGLPLDGIRYYGLSYLMGFLMAWLLLKLLYKQGISPLDDEARADLSFYMILGVMVGGRLGYMLLYNFGSLVNDPLSLFKVWEGGMASHGGFLGVVIAMAIFAKQKGVSFLKLADLCALICTPGIILGRIANFINGELWGNPSRVPWARIFPESQPVYIQELQGYFLIPRHPSQLYQAGLEGLGVGIYLWVRLGMLKDSLKNGKGVGLIGSEFLIAYGIMRIIGEIFRTPDAAKILFLSRGSFYSIIMIVIGVVLWKRIQKRDNAKA